LAVPVAVVAGGAVTPGATAVKPPYGPVAGATVVAAMAVFPGVADPVVVCVVTVPGATKVPVVPVWGKAELPGTTVTRPPNSWLNGVLVAVCWFAVVVPPVVAAPLNGLTGSIPGRIALTPP